MSKALIWTWYSLIFTLTFTSGLLKKLNDGVSVMGNGEITKKLTVNAHRFTKTAKEKIEAAGGKVVIINAK